MSPERLDYGPVIAAPDDLCRFSRPTGWSKKTPQDKHSGQFAFLRNFRVSGFRAEIMRAIMRAPGAP